MQTGSPQRPWALMEFTGRFTSWGKADAAHKERLKIQAKRPVCQEAAPRVAGGRDLLCLLHHSLSWARAARGETFPLEGRKKWAFAPQTHEMRLYFKNTHDGTLPSGTPKLKREWDYYGHMIGLLCGV